MRSPMVPYFPADDGVFGGNEGICKNWRRGLRLPGCAGCPDGARSWTRLTGTAASPRILPLMPGSPGVTLARRIVVDSPTGMTRRIALRRVGALAVALGALEAVGPFSFAPQRVGASIVPSDIQFD